MQNCWLFQGLFGWKVWFYVKKRQKKVLELLFFGTCDGIFWRLLTCALDCISIGYI